MTLSSSDIVLWVAVGALTSPVLLPSLPEAWHLIPAMAVVVVVVLLVPWLASRVLPTSLFQAPTPLQAGIDQQWSRVPRRLVGRTGRITSFLATALAREPTVDDEAVQTRDIADDTDDVREASVLFKMDAKGGILVYTLVACDMPLYLFEGTLTRYARADDVACFELVARRRDDRIVYLVATFPGACGRLNAAQTATVVTVCARLNGLAGDVHRHPLTMFRCRNFIARARNEPRLPNRQSLH